jgi:hypothetical protein
MKNFSFENKGGIKMGKKKSMSRIAWLYDLNGILYKEFVSLIGYNILGASAFLGVSERTVYYYLEKARIPSFAVINRLKHRMSPEAQRLIEYYEAL